MQLLPFVRVVFIRMRAWLIVLALAAGVSPASTLGPSRLIEVEVNNGVIAGIRRQATVPGVSLSNVVVTSDGRYAAWTVGPVNNNGNPTGDAGLPSSIGAPAPH